MNPGVRILCVTHAGVLGVFLVTGLSVSRAFSLIPLLCGPRQDDFHDLRHQEQANSAAEVFAHGFHVAVLKFDTCNSHKQGRCGKYLFAPQNGSVSARQWHTRGLLVAIME